MCPCDRVGIDGGPSEGRILGDAKDIWILSQYKADDKTLLDLSIVNELILHKSKLKDS